MHPREFKSTRDLVSIHKTICRQCGMCCYIKVLCSIENMRFIPVAQKLNGMDDEDRKYLSLQVCEHLDVETNKCEIYEKRPAECRKFFCKGDPRPQTIQIKGKGLGSKN